MDSHQVEGQQGCASATMERPWTTGVNHHRVSASWRCLVLTLAASCCHWTWSALRSVDTQFDRLKRHQSARPRTETQEGLARECGPWTISRRLERLLAHQWKFPDRAPRSGPVSESDLPRRCSSRECMQRPYPLSTGYACLVHVGLARPPPVRQRAVQVVAPAPARWDLRSDAKA